VRDPHDAHPFGHAVQVVDVLRKYPTEHCVRAFTVPPDWVHASAQLVAPQAIHAVPAVLTTYPVPQVAVATVAEAAVSVQLVAPVGH
jgi:hypothetical protein